MVIQLNYSTKYYNINSPRNQNTKNIGFQGLNRYFSKHFIEGGICKVSGARKSAIEFAMDAIKDNLNSRRYIGNLPSNWIAKCQKENRKEFVQHIQDLFGELAEKLCTHKYTPVTPGEDKHVSDFSKYLEEVLQVKVNMQKLPDGKISRKAYRLEVGDDKYTFIVFHKDIEHKYIKQNGEVIEPARAPYAKKKGCKSFVDFYFGRIATDISKDGFLITKFEDQHQKLTPDEEIKRLLRLLKSKVTTRDIKIEKNMGLDLNLIGRKIIDIGFLELLPENVHQPLKSLALEIGKYHFNTRKNSGNKLDILGKINKLRDKLPEFGIDQYIKYNIDDNLKRLLELTQIFK